MINQSRLCVPNAGLGVGLARLVKEVERRTVWMDEKEPQEKSELMDRNPEVLQTPFRES